VAVLYHASETGQPRVPAMDIHPPAA